MQPPRHHRKTRPPSAASGFTLLELMVVMSVMAILLALVAGTTMQSLTSMRVATSMGSFSNQVASAVLMATRDNSPVFVRIYRYDDGGVAGTQFRAFQLLGRRRDGTLPHEEITPVVPLSQGVVFHPDPAYSTLLSLPANTPAASDPILSLPPGYDFIEFQVRPDGSADLAKGQPWCITLTKDLPAPVVGTLLPDYRTVTINPLTCAIREY